MSQISEIIDEIAFRDELSTGTKFREFSKEENFDDSVNRSERNDDLNFDLPRRTASPPPEPEPIEDDYDAESNAQSLVYLMSSLDTVILNGVGMWKVNAKAGGRKALSEMKQIITKEIAGVELSEEDKQLLAKFKEYKANMKILETETPPSQSEIDRLIQMAIPYCESNKIKVGGGFAFWTGYGASLASRILKIINL